MIDWNYFDANLRFRERLIGGIPIIPSGADPIAVYQGWLKGQGLDTADAADLADSLNADETKPPSAPDDPQLANGFRRTEDGELFIEARQVKALLRESAQRLGIIKQVRGSRQVLQHDIHVRALDGTQRLLLGRTEPDGFEGRPISVITPQGPRTSIKRFEYVERAEIAFRVKILAGGVGNGLVDLEKLSDMLELGQDLGLGSDRSQGDGTFDVVSLAVVTDDE